MAMEPKGERVGATVLFNKRLFAHLQQPILYIFIFFGGPVYILAPPISLQRARRATWECFEPIAYT